VVSLDRETNIEEVNRTFKEESEGSLRGILGYSDIPLVSSDYIHSPYSAVFDSLETKVKGKMAKVLAWYDNEWGYSCRLIELAERMF
jgi:glyceraldehyde 3-phosphate dehydrogenase